MKTWLFLDTHERGSVRFGWITSEKVDVRMIHARAGDLLVILASDRERLQRMTGVCAVAGPGSFSAVRTGVLYANLFSRLLHVPLVGVSSEQGQDLSLLQRALVDGLLEPSTYVSPIYDAEPNITVHPPLLP